jgi:hypothetical protein
MGYQPKLWQYDTYHNKTWARKKPRLRYSLPMFEAFENQPQREGMRRIGKNIYRWGAYNDFPIERFVSDNVGRDYDEVFSEILSHIPKRLLYRSHVYTYWVLPSTYHPEGAKVHYLGHRGSFYVDLETKILYRAESADFYRPFDKDEYIIKYGYLTYVFKQLTTSDEFVDEGKTMRHCVSTYRKICRKTEDETSIWSFGYRCANGVVEKNLTIQISAGEIRQVRGYQNRNPTKKERDIIRYWAMLMRLSISKYAFGYENDAVPPQ